MPIKDLPETQLIGSCLEPVNDRMGLNMGGHAALVRLYIYEVRSSAPLLTQMAALVRVADYQLWLSDDLGSYESALGVYQYAYRQLRHNGIAPASIEAIFAPRIPVVLPALSPNPLVSEETARSAGHIDVAFDITKHGWSDAVEVLDTTKNASRAAEKDLLRVIRYRRFRPRIVDGEFADISRVVMRYYLDE
jgi:hypothetical protein